MEPGDPSGVGEKLKHLFARIALLIVVRRTRNSEQKTAPGARAQQALNDGGRRREGFRGFEGRDWRHKASSIHSRVAVLTSSADNNTYLTEARLQWLSRNSTLWFSSVLVESFAGFLLKEGDA